jgi:alkylation response protein AidB-like acyl-CoA dehydrogenase
MQYAELRNLREVLPGIRSRADRLDASGEWPEEDLRVLATLGAMRWAVPLVFGGEELSPIEMHFRYEAIASASLTTALILTQRDSAIGIISAAAQSSFRDELLAKLANNELFTTVGIAQLTTSRQRGRPAIAATAMEDGKFRVDGEVPWVTGAGHAQFIVCGAPLEDGRQILFALPTVLPGVRVFPPLPLVALRGSHTTSVQCKNVILEPRHILHGPAERVLEIRRNSLPIGQTFLAMGLTVEALNLMESIESDTAREARTQLESQLGELRGKVLDFCNPVSNPDPARGPELRGACIDLALRATHVAISLYKGASLLAGHPAQRLAREAMFLLVWSCPAPVVDCTVERMSEGRGMRAEG